MQPDSLGIYISIPFCRSKCTYCNFASGVYPASEHARYVERVIADTHSAHKQTTEQKLHLSQSVDTIYLGGGTPTLLSSDHLEQIFSAIHSEFTVTPDAEITVECAPGQLHDSVLEALVAIGVNRISLGVQSFIDREACSSGRLHDRAIIGNDLRRLRAAGIANISVDLIAGLAGQTMASWQESLQALVDTEVPHASLYMLEVDEDSRLGREMLIGGTRYHAELVPSEESIAQMYQVAIETLAAAGLAQYEISNFSRPGFESVHNLRYWHRKPYIGLGLDASSMLREAAESREVRRVLRSTTTDDLKSYIDGAPFAESSWLSAERQHEEAWFLGLRLNAGVSISLIREEFGEQMVAPVLEVIERQVDAGLLTWDGETVRLTRQGQLLSNEVFQEFLVLQV